MRREKMNNKGFSLVELIIVIAIMAILSAALAPQLMKYIEKSRKSTDDSSCTSIESCVNAALADEDVYKQVASAGRNTGVVVNISVSGSSLNIETLPETNGNVGSVTNNENLLKEELEESLGSLKEPKQTGKKFYVVTINTSEDTANGTTQVGKIDVETRSTAASNPAGNSSPATT